ncbi:MarR family winged helix-turn-helix transcriptional regulator [Pacificoceanicola onchidii]|uniref:MarR family winged helix-turn-helix transcriptional regulator n=1 Tax=Pacificoceanicola onchidii TaxID=2562685 RepID=UPI0010A5D1E6|nr:MarR family transcriptional regulator [Pacificoceanicola onchidii]
MKRPAPAHPDPEAIPKVDDSTLRGFVGYRMKRAFNVIQDDLSKTLKPFELRMLTYTALILIVDNPGLRQSQLADAMDVERPNLVVILDELERRELIVRDRVPTDRRAYALKATLAGRRLSEQAVAAVTAHEDRLMRGLDDGALETLRHALKTIEARKRRD